MRAGGALRARDQVGLRALNDPLKGAFDTPGKAGFEAGGEPSARAPLAHDEPEERSIASAGEATPTEPAPSEPNAPLRFKQSLLRMHPGERRGISLLIDADRIDPGVPVHVVVDPALGLNLWTDTVPEPVRGGWSRVSANLRCRVSADPGARLSVLAEAGGHVAELVVLVVRHRASGWVREIARMDEDALVEAHFDPETGAVTVYEGRREFKALERAARRAGLSKARVRSTSLTECSRSRSLRIPSTPRRRRRSSPAGSLRNARPSRPSTRPQSAAKRRRSATAPTRS